MPRPGVALDQYQPVILLLVNRGILVGAVDVNGETALQMAERLGKVDLAEVVRSLSSSKDSPSHRVAS